MNRRGGGRWRLPWKRKVPPEILPAGLISVDSRELSRGGRSLSRLFFRVESDREFAQGVEQLAVDGLVVLDGLVEGDVFDFVVADTNHDVALVFKQGVDGGSSHAAGQDTVVGRG